MMNSTKQIIGNRGIHPQATAYQAASRTNRPPYAQTRSYNQGVYPGPSSYTDFPGMAGTQLPAESTMFAQPPVTTGTGGEGGGLTTLFGGGSGGSAGGASSGGGFNLQQVSKILDRLGGIEGIVDTFSKMQKMVQSFQQFAPLIKVLLGSFGKGKAKDDEKTKPRRRRRRRRRSSRRNRRIRR